MPLPLTLCGAGEVEVFPASPPEGRQRIPTPHLNQFAREGIQFTQGNGERERERERERE